MKNLLKNRQEKGITLIALVVTIIVLLILAGISIAMLTGQNGILNRARQAKDDTIVGQEKEQVELAYVSAAVKKLGNNVEAKDLQDELDISVGEEKTIVTDNDNFFVIQFVDSGRYYEIDNGGNATEFDVYIDTTPGELAGTGTEEDPFRIESIEDLVTFSVMVNGGYEDLEIASNQFEGQNVLLARTLDFKSKISYCDYKTTKFDLYLGGNGRTELMTQLVTRKWIYINWQYKFQ